MSEGALTLAAYCPANFFTGIGAWKKRRDLRRRGLPDLKDAKLLTLTVDPKCYPHPADAFEKGRNHLPTFMYRLRQELGEHVEYLWRLEFHRNGYPHWHVLIVYKPKIDPDLLRKHWGKGLIDIRRADGKAVGYLFDYISKKNDLPEWVCEYDKRTIRMYGSSRGFFRDSQLRQLVEILHEPDARLPAEWLEEPDIGWLTGDAPRPEEPFLSPPSWEDIPPPPIALYLDGLSEVPEAYKQERSLGNKHPHFRFVRTYGEKLLAWSRRLLLTDGKRFRSLRLPVSFHELIRQLVRECLHLPDTLLFTNKIITTNTKVIVCKIRTLIRKAGAPPPLLLELNRALAAFRTAHG